MNKLKSISFLFFTTMISVNYCFSQNFASQDSRWTFDFMLSGITEMFYEKDTILFDRDYRKFVKRNTNIHSGDTIVQYFDPVFFHDDNGVVTYTKDLTYFDTLFNFNALEGDAWTIYSNSLKEDSVKIEVLDIFSTKINNVVLLSQSLSYTRSTPTGPTSFVDTIYEDIGAKYLYILPFEAWKLYPEGGIVRCFVNEKLGVVDLDNAYSYGFYLYSDYEYECNDTVTSLSSEKETSFSFGPNPVADILYLRDIPEASKFVQFYNLNGSLVKREEIINSNQEVNLSVIAEGIYFFSINKRTYYKLVLM